MFQFQMLIYIYIYTDTPRIQVNMLKDTHHTQLVVHPAMASLGAKGKAKNSTGVGSPSWGGRGAAGAPFHDGFDH
jgi:hypothetical protein